MAKQTTTAANFNAVTSVNNNQFLLLTDANGSCTKISLANLRNALLNDYNMDALDDGVFIMYHQSSYMYISTLSTWATKEQQGYIADGVLLSQGGKVLVIAPTEGAELKWGNTSSASGATRAVDYPAALDDWNGRTNTTAILNDPISADTDSAAGFCNAYSRMNSQGYGLTAGKWWLPSMGEMMMICTHLNKINYALSLINGATPISESDKYWTSTEGTDTVAWSATIQSYGRTITRDEKSRLSKVRPVCTFIQ